MPPRLILRLARQVPTRVAGRVLDRARRWPETSQLQARRNAMVAATALAQRRAEHAEVEAYLLALHQEHAALPHADAAPARHG